MGGRTRAGRGERWEVTKEQENWSSKGERLEVMGSEKSGAGRGDDGRDGERETSSYKGGRGRR